MAVNLQITLGTVNYTDFLHVTAAKVSDPGAIVWETWINVPVANYNFVIPGLDPDDYYVSFYDSPDNVSLGTLVSQCFVNAKTNEYQYELIFYTIGALPDGVTINDELTEITDPYLNGKTIASATKEGFRPLDPADEYTFDNVSKIALTTGNFSDGEKFCVTIKYATGTVSASAGGLYTGTLNVTEATKTLLAADKNKRIRCVGVAATQVITAMALSSINIDDGLYFDNSCGGVAVQVKILIPGADRIRFNGFMTVSNEFAEFWVSKGEHFLMRKFNDDYWEIITDYKGVYVGERFAARYKNMPGALPEDGALIDGNEYGRKWWFVDGLPVTHVIIDDDVIDPGYVHPAGKEGLFVKHSTLKKFRMPNTQSMSEKGLKNFNTYGADATRVYDYPGGFQEQKNLKHRHFVANSHSGTGNTSLTLTNKLNFQNETGGIGDFKYTFNGSNDEPNIGLLSESGGDFNIVNNIGVIYVSRI